MSQARLCVLSGRYPGSRFASIYNHRAYCNRHKYTYIHCTWPTGQGNPYLNKLAYIREYFDFFDFLFWIDDDAFFLDLEKPLSGILPSEGKCLSICSSPGFKTLKTFFSSGQFVLRCDALGKDLILSALELSDDTVKKWWSEEYGFFTGGDQDRMVFLCNTEKKFSEAYQLWDYKHFNSRASNIFGEDPHEVFILHFTGTRRRKSADYARIQKKLRRGPSLLTKEQEASLGMVEPIYKRALRFAKSRIKARV
jgi:hypothetical protein